MSPSRRLSPPLPTSETNSVREWCDAQGIAHIETDNESGEMWTKGPTDVKAVEASDRLWDVLEAGVEEFMEWVWENSWRWSDADTLFEKFKIWLANEYGDDITLEEKNAIYVGLALEVADIESGATMAHLGKNFDEGNAMIGTENILPNGYSNVPDTLTTMISAFPNCEIRLNEKVVRVATVVDGTADSGRRVTVTVDHGAIYTASRVVVSVPLGVLQYGTIAFDPELSSDKATAIAKLGMGLLNKITLLYSQNFWWKDTNELGKSTWFTVVDPTANPLGEEPPKPQREFFNAVDTSTTSPW